MQERLSHSSRLDPSDVVFLEFAGRLGHDLNNLLGTIIGGLGLLREEQPMDEHTESQQLIDDALSAARECATLVDRLMASAGRQNLRAQRVDLNSVAESLSQLLAKTLPANIQVQTSLEPDLPAVSVDGDRLQEALANIAVNAREAMPEGGKLAITTGLSESGHVNVVLGDEGCGMAPEVQSRVLEPLFSTKTSGLGRGLGLSVVNGFVRQSGGSLSIESQPGSGTRVTLNFPALSE